MPADRGSYVLLLRMDDHRELAVGALGPKDFQSGAYAYVGSALGPGGFSRLERHRNVAAGESGTRHWHIDYLLGDPGVEVCEAIRFPDREIECRLAQTIRTPVIPGFGASDCPCESHLFYRSDLRPLKHDARSLEG